MNKIFQTHYRKNISFFDRWAKSYDHGRISGWFQYTQELTIGLLDLEPSSKVLDVGCGTGHAVIKLAGILSHGKACGIDISSEMIEQARAKIPDILKEKAEFLQASSDNIPYPNDEFDYVLCTNSFHHYPDPIRSLEEIQKVLKPGGQMVIFENAPDLSWYTWMWDRLLRIIEKGHVRYYPSHELGAMIKQAQFDDVELRYLKNEFIKHGKIFASIQVWSGRRPLK